MQRRIQPILARYQKKIATAINSGRTTDVALQGLFDELRAALGPELAGIMTQRSLELTAETGITFDAAVISEEALGWARNHAADLVTGVTDTTRKLVNQSVSTFIETPGMTRADLEKLLSPAFGKNRAEMIAVTEVTRAYSEATNQQQQLIRDETGMEMRRRWDTLRDDLTCIICGPLNGMPEEEWRDKFPKGPPAHVNCRCSTSLTMDDEATVRAEAIAKQTAREKLLREQVAGEKPGVVARSLLDESPDAVKRTERIESAIERGVRGRDDDVLIADETDRVIADLKARYGEVTEDWEEIDYSYVENMIYDWSVDSHSDEAIYLQVAANQELGSPLSEFTKGKLGRDVSGLDWTNERRLVRQIYDDTQAELRASGIGAGDRVALYRGKAGAPPFEGRGVARGNALESWTTSRDWAEFYVKRNDELGEGGYVIAASVPADQIAGLPHTGLGVGSVSEVVILGGNEIDIDILAWP